MPARRAASCSDAGIGAWGSAVSARVVLAATQAARTTMPKTLAPATSTIAATTHSVIVIRGHTAAPTIQPTCTAITPATTAIAIGCSRATLKGRS